MNDFETLEFLWVVFCCLGTEFTKVRVVKVDLVIDIKLFVRLRAVVQRG